MHDYLLAIGVIVIFAYLGGFFAKNFLDKFKRIKKYIILASLFVLVIIVSELMKEGFAALGSFAAVSMGGGFLALMLLNKYYKNRTILYHEAPKLIGFAASYAVALDLGQAIAILISIQNIFQGGLFILNNSLKSLAREMFKFVILGIIAFTVFNTIPFLIKVHIMTVAAGMILYKVIYDGFFKGK